MKKPKNKRKTIQASGAEEMTKIIILINCHIDFRKKSIELKGQKENKDT